MARVKFVLPKNAGVRADVAQRVDAYFRDNALSKHWNATMMAKVIFYVGGYAGTYALLAMFAHTAAAYVGGMLLMGAWMAGIGFNVGHDAAHDAFSASSRANRLVAHSF